MTRLNSKKKSCLQALQDALTHCQQAIDAYRNTNVKDERNFDVVSQEIPGQGRLLRLAPRNPATPQTILNEDLGPGYRFIHGTGNLTHSLNKTISLPMDRIYTQTFPYDAMHETSHSRRERDERFVGNAQYMALVESPSPAEADALLSLLESMTPAAGIAAERRAAMVALLRGELPPEEYLHVEDHLTARSEWESWRFAEEKTGQLERSGYDFAFPPEQRVRYAQECLLGSDIGTLVVKISQKGPIGVKNATPVYVNDPAYTERVAALISNLAKKA